MEHNKQNRQTVEGEKHNQGKKETQKRRHGGRCGLERYNQGRIYAGRLQWKPFFNFTYGQTEVSFTGQRPAWVCGKVIMREWHQAELWRSLTLLCLMGLSSDRMNWRPGCFNTNPELAGRMDTQRANPAALWLETMERIKPYTSSWWLSAPRPQNILQTNSVWGVGELWQFFPIWSSRATPVWVYDI